MNAPNHPKKVQRKKLRFPHWLIPFYFAIEIPVALFIMLWACSLLTPHYGQTMVRLPIVVDEPPLGQVQVNASSPRGKKISGYDLANLVVAQVTERTYVRKVPFVGNQKQVDHVSQDF